MLLPTEKLQARHPQNIKPASTDAPDSPARKHSKQTEKQQNHMATNAYALIVGG